jgi:hypothetical protein
MSDKEEGGFRRAENYSQYEEIQVVEVGCTLARIRLWEHNKRNQNLEKIEDRIKTAMFQNFEVPIQPLFKI